MKWLFIVLVVVFIARWVWISDWFNELLWSIGQGSQG